MINLKKSLTLNNYLTQLISDTRKSKEEKENNDGPITKTKTGSKCNSQFTSTRSKENEKTNNQS